MWSRFAFYFFNSRVKVIYNPLVLLRLLPCGWLLYVIKFTHSASIEYLVHRVNMFINKQGKPERDRFGINLKEPQEQQ